MTRSREEIIEAITHALKFSAPTKLLRVKEELVQGGGLPGQRVDENGYVKRNFGRFNGYGDGSVDMESCVVLPLNKTSLIIDEKPGAQIKTVVAFQVEHSNGRVFKTCSVKTPEALARTVGRLVDQGIVSTQDIKITALTTDKDAAAIIESVSADIASLGMEMLAEARTQASLAI